MPKRLALLHWMISNKSMAHSSCGFVTNEQVAPTRIPGLARRACDGDAHHATHIRRYFYRMPLIRHRATLRTPATTETQPGGTFGVRRFRAVALLLIGVTPIAGIAQGGNGNVGAADGPGTSCCSSRYGRAQLDSLDLPELGKEFKRMRRARCEACDLFGSDLMRVMNALGTRLDGKSKKLIKQVMGPPDHREGRTLIYDWREGHDQLEFTFGEDGKGAMDWYQAYE